MALKTDTLLVLGGLGVLGYVLVKAFGFGKEVIDKGAGAVVDLWYRLNPMPPIELLGMVRFPGNLKVPLQRIGNANVRQDANHNVFVKYAGYTWQLSPQVNGEWPATRVS